MRQVFHIFVNVRVLLMLLVIAGVAMTAVAEPKRSPGYFSNPILAQEIRAGADPAVIYHDGKYYFYSTNGTMSVFISEDLVHWRKGPRVMPDEFRGVWAPEVYYHPEDGKFYLYYTKRYKIGVAVGDRPDGMFKDLGLLAIDGIDAHMFRDDDGRLYLYFTNTPTFTMYCVPMKSPTQTGGPVTKCFEVSQEWEKHDHALNEGPWMYKKDGQYQLMYSGSNGQTIYYAIGIATAPTPIGPFTKYEKNPVFQDLPKIHGPGHGSVARDRDGQLWHLYHQKTSEKKGWARDICLDRLLINEDGILFGQPTRGVKQLAPVCNSNVVWSPDIHPRGAIFNDQVEITLTSNTPDAVIYYTLDGSEPSDTSTRFTAPFTVNNSVVVKAIAYKNGMRTSTVESMRFTRTDEPLPANPSPDAPAGNPPFEVFEKPNLNWTPPQQ